MDEQGIDPLRDEPTSLAALATLTARVAELERVVAQLQGGHTRQPAPRVPHATPAPPPMPSMPALSASAALPMLSTPTVDSGEDDPAESAAPQARTKSLEDRVGAQVFNMVGIVALIFAAAYGLKLAIEYGYLGPVARVLVGLAVGVGLVLWSERFRRKGFAAFSYSLKAVGTAVLYLTLWAAFQLYHLLPATIALIAMILVTAWNAFMAWSQDAELLAGYALLGGFLTPLLVSTGGDHEIFLFTYLAAIDLAAVVLMRTKPWRRLLLPAFAATALFFIGWYVQFYRYDTISGTGPFGLTIGFILLFFAIFAVVSIKGWMDAETDKTGRAGDAIVTVLLPLANAAFVALSLYSVLQDSGMHGSLAWLMLALAALYLGLMRVQRTAVSSAMHLAMAVVFLTIAVPLKASGHTLTTAWLVEGLVLFWASTRFEREQVSAARVLWILSAGGYVLGLASLVAHWFLMSESVYQPFFNHNLAAALMGIATLAGAVWIAVEDRAGKGTPEAIPTAGLSGIGLVAILLTGRELGSTLSSTVDHPAFANPDFATALAGLIVLAAVTWVAVKLRQRDAVRYADLNTFAGTTLIVFNLLILLSVEHEIGALWHRTDANLQRSLAISGFLMAYGAGLLALGFWKRVAFIRWQALALLLFTICKVFLYDIGSLSAGYRVVSFLGLGAVLMAVSFAYQKDWLGLKDPPAPSGTAAEKADIV